MAQTEQLSTYKTLEPKFIILQSIVGTYLSIDGAQ